DCKPPPGLGRCTRITTQIFSENILRLGFLPEAIFKMEGCPYEQWRNAQINLRHRLEIIETDNGAVAKRQGATIGRGAGVLHRVLARTAHPAPACGHWSSFPRRYCGRLEQAYRAGGLLSRQKCDPSDPRHRADCCRAREEHTCYDHRDRFGLI